MHILWRESELLLLCQVSLSTLVSASSESDKFELLSKVRIAASSGSYDFGCSLLAGRWHLHKSEEVALFLNSVINVVVEIRKTEPATKGSVAE
ncbi:hypothetical protein TNCV_3259011 [Trichonephila clavipes]|nr:hypothetical protein TNCV_3259011 [Trichonephila clavipes]